jgi:heme/copper-type cytochrome/quinol oxidase subunit 1
VPIRTGIALKFARVTVQTSVNRVCSTYQQARALKMFTAKLFASLAVLQLSLSLLGSKMSQGGIDLYLHGTYFVVFHIRHLPILMSLISGSFGLICLVASRMRQPLNNSLALTHFVLTTIGFILFSMLLFLPKSGAISEVTHHWLGLAVLLGALSFLAGCVLLAVCMDDYRGLPVG